MFPRVRAIRPAACRRLGPSRLLCQPAPELSQSRHTRPRPSGCTPCRLPRRSRAAGVLWLRRTHSHQLPEGGTDARHEEQRPRVPPPVARRRPRRNPRRRSLFPDEIGGSWRSCPTPSARARDHVAFPTSGCFFACPAFTARSRASISLSSMCRWSTSSTRSVSNEKCLTAISTHLYGGFSR